MNEIIKEICDLFKVKPIYFENKTIHDPANAKKALVFLAVHSGIKYKEIEKILPLKRTQLYKMKVEAMDLMDMDDSFMLKMKEVM